MAWALGAASKKFVSFPARKTRGSNSASSFLYLISEGQDGPVKIGRSRSPGVRLSELQTGNARRLRVFATYELTHDEACDAERLLHEELAGHAMSGEWFALSEKFMAEYMPDFFLSEGLEPKNGAN